MTHRHDVPAILARIAAVTHGFKPLQVEAEQLTAGIAPGASYALARDLFATDLVPARMLAVLICERIVGEEPAVLAFLEAEVSCDPSWQVQEMLARAFDATCRCRGYQESLPLMRAWLAAGNHNLRRAVSEGLRPWTARPYFKQHPAVAIALLSGLRADPVAYVRTSAGNALRDISRREPDLVRAELSTWDLGDPATRATYLLASRVLS